MRLRSLSCVLAACLLAFAPGCLPTAEPAASPTPATTPGTAIPAPPAQPEAAIPAPAAVAAPAAAANRLPAAKITTVPGADGAAPEKKMSLSVQNTAAAGPGNASIRVEPQADGSFVVNGGQALNGTLKRAPEGGWIFDATIKFPTQGYTVGAPFTSGLDDMALAPGGATVEKKNAMTTLTIPFKFPAQGAASAGELAIPINHKFDAPADTKFVVFLLPTL